VNSEQAEESRHRVTGPRANFGLEVEYHLPPRVQDADGCDGAPLRQRQASRFGTARSTEFKIGIAFLTCNIQNMKVSIIVEISMAGKGDRRGVPSTALNWIIQYKNLCPWPRELGERMQSSTSAKASKKYNGHIIGRRNSNKLQLTLIKGTQTENVYQSIMQTSKRTVRAWLRSYLTLLISGSNTVLSRVTGGYESYQNSS
jgi:hypothetical protein